MAQTKTEKVLGLVSEVDIIEERKSVAKLLWHLNNMPGGFTKSKLASIMGLSLIDFINIYDDYFAKLEEENLSELEKETNS